MTQTATMGKRTSHAFGKTIYLLGKDKHSELLWLEKASWDCDWYWGFGYIERYTNNNPELARDISSHSHWSGLVGKQEYYDHDKQCFRLATDYIHHLNDNPDMTETTLTDGESWELADLMKSFYTLKDTAELYHSGNSHLTSQHSLDLKNKEQEDYINNELLPQIFKRVYEILSPDNS